ncbi:hypothetical protein ABB37_06071 [Leptomonas pyrrhocoris]|uniref:Uncharacterized protein n=1 Tax=Leptomonas pyrrhocoris TaxID=157538 RepID=A0A0N0VEJ0_LEPPY|nr:hypothetical protein ABB37_06071 [Leptomonas pyrrhocoris]KPA78444.1 hypothetical protein ABB37_06071 [Leptomonas pyrrhocoris]|eukprot:XP_015656883.1 hypothetical protein ABB37_06071 [Leptomonas pyrrhocoris]
MLRRRAGERLRAGVTALSAPSRVVGHTTSACAVSRTAAVLKCLSTHDSRPTQRRMPPLYFCSTSLLTFPGTVSRVATVTDHYPIAFAQRGENGFRGIGRGQYLNHLYALTNDLFFNRDITVVFFYILGSLNPADSLCRNFGDDVDDGRVVARVAEGRPILRLMNTSCPLCPRHS